ncbi:hypothetical protein DFH07DRAFT_849634 [Mycena maculata]|uniref:Uncharacterized protein n=1 Tax=Mycena maculata TaxID=230809 RepID=A0AAD7MT91_9AGAR|nr:hypothetical protein DFH07DRAFT_849634 [Mycena maculata]
MPATVLADSTNSLKRSRSTHFSGGPSHKKQCSGDRKARCDPVVQAEEEIPTRFQTPVCELERIFRRLAKTVDYATLKALMAAGSDQARGLPRMVQSIIEHAQARVEKSQILKGKQKMLQAELYLEWLREYEFVLAAVQNVLRAKVPIATGKTLFSILFHLIDQYISAVDAQQDGCSHRSWVMTLVEEANDSSTDERSTAAVTQAEAQLERFDAVMALALERYRSDSRAEYRKLAGVIGQKQETLARGCCLLSEQTGYGDADDMGFGLLVTTREAMLEWKEQRTTVSKPSDATR